MGYTSVNLIIAPQQAYQNQITLSSRWSNLGLHYGPLESYLIGISPRDPAGDTPSQTHS